MELVYTSGELETTRAYNNIAKQMSKTHSDLNFWQPEFEKFTSLLPGKEVIDIGCGWGRDAQLFIKLGCNYLGIDLSQKMLEQAKKLTPNAQFLKMSMYSLDLPSGHFDGVWAVASLLHIPKKNLEEVLKEIRRVVKPGGIGFFTMKEGDGEKMVFRARSKNGLFFAYYHLNEFSDALTNAGFDVLEKSKGEKKSNDLGGASTRLLYFARAK